MTRLFLTLATALLLATPTLAVAPTAEAVATCTFLDPSCPGVLS